METSEVVERITALRDLSAATGTRTTRAQNTILQSLPDAVLADVAVQLKRQWALKAAQDGK